MWHSLKSHRLAWHLLAFCGLCLHIWRSPAQRALRNFSSQDEMYNTELNARNHAHPEPPYEIIFYQPYMKTPGGGATHRGSPYSMCVFSRTQSAFLNVFRTFSQGYHEAFIQDGSSAIRDSTLGRNSSKSDDDKLNPHAITSGGMSYIVLWM